MIDAPKLEDGKWIEFYLAGDTGKTLRYGVRSKERPGSLLGVIKWYSPWRCYAFFAGANTVFETDCLGTIQAAVYFVNEHRKAQRAGRVA